MSDQKSAEAWDALLRTVRNLGEVEVTDQGFILRFVDAAGRPRELTALISPDEWTSYLWDWANDDADDSAALEKAVGAIRASGPQAKALMVREYGLLFAPYVPRF